MAGSRSKPHTITSGPISAEMDEEYSMQRSQGTVFLIQLILIGVRSHTLRVIALNGFCVSFKVKTPGARKKNVNATRRFAGS